MCITIIFMYVDGIISNIYFLDSMEDDDRSAIKNISECENECGLEYRYSWPASVIL